MDFSAFKQAVIEEAEKQGITQYELYYKATESTSVTIFKDEINEFTASLDGGVCFRCIVNGKMGYASTEALTNEQAAAIVSRAADNARTLESEDPAFLGEGGQSYERLERTQYPLPSAEMLISTALCAQAKLYASDERVVDGSGTQGIAEKETVSIYNTNGLDLRYENNIAGLVVNPVVSDGNEKAEDYDIKLGSLDKLDIDAMTGKATKSALEKLGGDVAPTGNYPVVFSPEAMASLLQVYSSVFSAEAAQKGLSRLAGREGEQVASPLVTLVDDPFHQQSPAPVNFDAEGSPTRCKNVIENGVLKTLLYNLKTAAVAGKTTTGNAAKGSYNAAVTVRPFTMYLAPGSLTEEQLLEKAGNGVCINSLGGLHAGANPISGDFSLQSAGFMIENGVKTVHVKSFTVAGNFFELLRNITAVSDRVKLPNAMGMTAFGSPSVLVEGLSIAGK